MKLLTDTEFNEEMTNPENASMVIFISGQDIQETRDMRDAIKFLSKSYDMPFFEMPFKDSEDFRLRYQIHHSPSLVLFIEGMIGEVITGFYDRHHLRMWLNENTQ